MANSTVEYKGFNIIQQVRGGLHYVDGRGFNPAGYENVSSAKAAVTTFLNMKSGKTKTTAAFRAAVGPCGK